ncbi:MAG TPA: hypothetical protein V6D14_07595 [Coleofasciculaceae cyanobacterium]|jgi:hypothetical protein
MRKTVKQDLTTQFKQLQLKQLQVVLKNYKQAQAKASVEMDTEALVEAIAHLEEQLCKFDAELNSLSA